MAIEQALSGEVSRQLDQHAIELDAIQSSRTGGFEGGHHPFGMPDAFGAGCQFGIDDCGMRR